MSNSEIKALAKARGVRLWQLALSLGVSEATITRWLRVPLSAEREAALLAAMETAAEREEAQS